MQKHCEGRVIYFWGRAFIVMTQLFPLHCGHLYPALGFAALSTLICMNVLCVRMSYYNIN